MFLRHTAPGSFAKLVNGKMIKTHHEAADPLEVSDEVGELLLAEVAHVPNPSNTSLREIPRFKRVSAPASPAAPEAPASAAPESPREAPKAEASGKDANKKPSSKKGDAPNDDPTAG